MHNRNLLMTKDGGGKLHNLVPSAQPESSVKQSGSFVHKLCIY
jgi:hypothetical protein